MYKDIIEIETKTFSVNLRLNSIISVATGYSSTGKTFLIKMLELLKDINASRIKKTNINIDDIIVCRRENDIINLLKLNSDCEGKTIFIDRYDYLHSDELKDFILSGKNRIILMSHTFYSELKLNAESFIIIKYNKDKREFFTEELIDHLDEEII